MGAWANFPSVSMLRLVCEIKTSNEAKILHTIKIKEKFCLEIATSQLQQIAFNLEATNTQAHSNLSDLIKYWKTSCCSIVLIFA